MSNLSPSDILPRIEIYGQHEISELAKSKSMRTRLLRRFADRDVSLEERRADIRRELVKTRQLILNNKRELSCVEERLERLPAVEETLERFRDAGLEDRLRERSLLVREEQLLESTSDRLKPFDKSFETLRQALPIDRAFLSPEALEDLPGRKILADADAALKDLSAALERVLLQFDRSLHAARCELAEVREQWSKRKQEVQESYRRILRSLQKAAVDAEEFIRLRAEIESLRPLKQDRTRLRKLKEDYLARRRDALVDWENLKAEDFRNLDRAAKTVGKKLRNSVVVEVKSGRDRKPLIELLRDKIGGRLSELLDTLEGPDTLSLPELVNSCRKGAHALQETYGIPAGQAKRLADAPDDVLMQIEELELRPTTAIRLNIASADESPAWRSLEELSTGQKATAVLLLLLLESDAPLVVDQPEDDLDNRFITQVIVPRIREGKRCRQFVFSTHNANIPVLADAELILGLTATGDTNGGHAKIRPAHRGSIDSASVRQLVEDLLEGGRDAFETRRRKYGF